MYERVIKNIETKGSKQRVKSSGGCGNIIGE